MTLAKRAQGTSSNVAARCALAAIAAVAAAALVAPAAQAGGSGGIGNTGSSSAEAGPGPATPHGFDAAKYDRLYSATSIADRRWARETSECESGGDPEAIGGGGIYRGAFQFLKSTWRASPKSPGGDPIVYPYRTQAVVAIYLRKVDGSNPWPVCG